MKNETFLPASQHFDKLLHLLEPADIQAYWALMNTRVEEAYRGRTFVIYEYIRGQAFALDHLVVTAFDCDDELGASMELKSNRSGREMVVGYSPVRLWEHPVFVWLPLHARLRWSALPSEALTGGSLAFPVCIRTASRLNLREHNVIYCETGVSYAREFERAAAAQ